MNLKSNVTHFLPLQTAFVVDEVSNIVKEVRGEMPAF